MNKKILGNILKVLILLAIVFSFAGCDFLFKTYTMQITNWTYTGMYTVEYKLSSETEWTEADFVDENGKAVMKIEYGNADYPDTAYFDVPEPGTYDFRGLNVLNEVIVGTIENCEVIYDNMGLDYAHTIDISYTDSIHGFN